MERLVEYWGPLAIIAGTFLGAFLIPLVGYLRGPKNGTSSGTIHGAMMIDSRKAQGVIDALDRIALVAEKMELHMKETADTEAEDRRVRAAIEAARVKWEQEHKG